MQNTAKIRSFVMLTKLSLSHCKKGFVTAKQSEPLGGELSKHIYNERVCLFVTLCYVS